MVRLQFAAALLGAYLLMTSVPVAAGIIEFDQDVHNNVIFGSGVANGGFTTFRETIDTVDFKVDLELGLRAKVRFTTPENTFLSQGDGFYGPFVPGGPGASIPLGTTAATPNWSFEWSINTDYLGNFGVKLDRLTYEIRIDSDPDPVGTSFLAFDPIHQTYVDSAIGDNSTGNGGGTVAPLGDSLAYQNLIKNNNLAQNSWRMDFFFPGFNPNLTGIYTIELDAFDDEGKSIGFSSINVVVGDATAVPEASSLFTWMGLAACFGLVMGSRQKKQAAFVESD